MKKFQIGEIINVHGLHGELKFWPYFNEPDFLKSIKKIYLEGRQKPFTLLSATPYKSIYRIQLAEINTRLEAEKFKNAVVFIEEESLPKLQKNKFYFFQLLDMEVYLEDNRYLGKLEEIIQGTVNDIYVVRNNKREFLIPAVDEFILDTDIEQQRMIVHIIEGMENEN